LTTRWGGHRLTEEDRMTITGYGITELTKTVAGLVAQGVTFKAILSEDAGERWSITLTGGY
jgi:hypothetical protein